ncbi:efflux RND transporter periplasmic adaptor subunit [Salinisphaera sp.]|uniref:efflux RND transporter periplasmic adaptor subunit n=1 Tax=Salinisphaera sp. TaxID=1914330 RepID=UPI000C3E5F32|nr:efflux RND transporter periplasmic adaptor subunit [Salinisphaera sp.]MBS62680.1 efflux transporter periplasmic adaptor subunit [Salinisphaera sp.]
MNTNNSPIAGLTRAAIVAAALLLAACNSATDDSDHATPTAHSEEGDHAHTGQGEGEGGEHAHNGHDEHEASPDRVELSAEQRAELDIGIGQARAASNGATIVAPATVEFDADRVARVGPRLQAKVVDIAVDLGQPVDKGDTLAVLDSVALGKEKAAYLTASARYRTRRAAYARDRKLAADQIVSDSDLAETRAAYEQARAERRAERAELRLYGLDDTAIDAIDDSADTPLSRMRLIAPRAGVIARRDLVAGQTLDANETPIHIVDNSRMWLMIDAAEQDLPRLQTGQTVEFRVRPLPDTHFNGHIDWVSPRLDAEARTVQVRAIVENPQGLLRAGMFATARIDASSDGGKSSDTNKIRVVVPADAIQQIDTREGVFVPAEEQGAFLFMPVATGEQTMNDVEIASGLAVGDRLVVSGAFDLKAALTAKGRSAAHSH